MKRRTCVVAAMLSLVAGCGVGGGAKGPSSRTYPLKGVVRKVDIASGEVTISHEAIPGVMSKMTMPFFLKDKSVLEDVRPGDEVEGPLRVDFVGDRIEDMDLTDLTVTRPSTGDPPGSEAATTSGVTALRPGELVPDFAVTTQDGSRLRLSDLRGKVVVLTFVYTRCPSPEFCPAMDAKFAELARRISASPARSDRIRLLSVSFDPDHDTPEVLAAHARRRGAREPLWTFAVASFPELEKVAGPLGLTFIPGTREIEHNIRTAVIGPDGRLVRLEPGGGWDVADLLGTAYSLVSKAGR